MKNIVIAILVCLVILSVPLLLSIFFSGVKNPTEYISENLVERIWTEKNDSLSHHFIYLPQHSKINARNISLYQCLGYQYIKRVLY